MENDNKKIMSIVQEDGSIDEVEWNRVKDVLRKLSQ